MTYFVNFLFLLASFFLMEFVAWSSHKYLMHGLLWFLHKDHHVKPPKQKFEFNDLFFFVFATPGIVLLYLGFQEGLQNPMFWIGAGISLYGMAYVFVHDIAVHQRIRVFTKLNNSYFRAIRKAHKIHHKYLTKEDGENFGILWVAKRYLDEAKAAGQNR